jgi:hypothetical protein
MASFDLLRIYFDAGQFGIEINYLPVILLFLTLACLLYFSGKFSIFDRWSPVIEMSIPLGGLGSVSIKADDTVSQIAYTAWTELITRKAGLQIDLENDIFTEVYNSWYQLFGNTRELIKTVPASQLKKKNTKVLVNLLVDALNKGLRPHLTKWQGRYRKWYENELTKDVNRDKTPQEIQKMYPRYQELTEDLVIINQQMITYTNELKRLVKFES